MRPGEHNRDSCGKPWSHWRMAEAIRAAGQGFCAKFLVAPLATGGGGHPPRTRPDRPDRPDRPRQKSRIDTPNPPRAVMIAPAGGQMSGATPWLSRTGIGFPVAILGSSNYQAKRRRGRKTYKSPFQPAGANFPKGEARSRRSHSSGLSDGRPTFSAVPEPMRLWTRSATVKAISGLRSRHVANTDPGETVV